MTRPPEDLQFARYQRTGDPAALAAVFDATAPRLLLAAMHLARDTAAAEDLVQATFVAAMRHPERYDQSRPLLPWLAGILARQAAFAWRQGSRRLDPARLANAGPPDPAAIAEAREVTLEVTRAIEALPAIYRDVLVLRLVHGLQSRQIAQALGRSPDTVRSQIRRGLELLRDALPRSLAVSLVAGVLAGRGLGAVREAVVAEAVAVHEAASVAGGVTAPAVLAFCGGGVLVQKVVLSLLGVACAAVLCFVAWPEPIDTAPAAVAANHAAVSLHKNVAAVDAAEIGTVARDDLPAPRAPAASTTPTAVLRGRCVAAENGVPLAGCVVAVDAVEGLPERALEFGDDAHWRAPAPVTTGPDGEFEIAFAATARRDVTLLVTAAGRASLAARWRASTLGDGRSLGDLELPPGSRVLGRVVDEEGAPVAGVPLHLQVESLPCGSEPGTRMPASATSAADGSFTLPAPVPRGTWAGVVLEGYRLAAPFAVAVPAPPAPVTVDVVVEHPAGESITGVVVDSRGTPVASARMSALGDAGSVSAAVETAADGSFTLIARGDAKAAVRLQCVPHGSNGAIVDERRVLWGTRDVRLVVDAPAPPPTPRSVRLQVVDAATGRPMERYGIRAGRLPDSPYRPFGEYQLQQMDRHENGELTLPPPALPGPHALIVCPEDGELRPSPLVTFDPAPAGGVLRVELHRRTTLRVQVRSRAGEPIAGSRVQLLQRWLAEEPRPWEAAPIGITDPRSTRQSFVPGLLWDAQVSDADGEVRLAAAPATPLMLNALGPGHVPRHLHPVTVGEDDATVVLEVEVGATLSGALLPRDLASRFHCHTIDASLRDGAFGSLAAAGICVRPVATSVPPHRERSAYESVPIAADGTFAISGIRPGTYDVTLRWQTPHVTATHGGRASQSHEYPLARVQLGDGERRQVTLDGSAFVPGSLRGRILLGGQPYADADWCFVVIPAAGSAFCTGGARTDAGGCYALPAAPPGRYRLRLVLRSAADGGWVAVDDEREFEVLAGEDVQRDFDVPRRLLRVSVRAADGTPLAEQQVAVTLPNGAEHFTQARRTDARGMLVFDPAPAVPIAVAVPLEPIGSRELNERIGRLRDKPGVPAGCFGFPDVRVDPSQRETLVVLQLPRAARQEK